MADIRTPLAGTGLVPQTRQPPVRVDAARAAQKAFFEAALNGSASPAPEARTVSKAMPPLHSEVAPGRLLRPGSLVDIKV